MKEQAVRLSFVAFIILVTVLLARSLVQAAPCPLTIQSLSLAGRGVEGKAVMYSITADLSGPTPMSAIIQVQSKKGSSIIDWPAIAPPPVAPSAGGPQATGSPAPASTSPPQAKMWFERKTDDVVNVSVASTGGVACESPTTAPSISTTSFPVVTIYDDANHHVALPERSPLDHIPMIKDAMFTKKADLVYPQMAQDQGITGTVVVGVDIGGDGKALYAWIHSRAVSPIATTLLDAPAIWQALNSTYAPMVSDGRPKTSTYLIVYEFKLEDFPDKGADVSQCPAVIESLLVSVSDRSDHTQWYTLSVSAKGTAPPKSIVIGVRDSQRKSTGMVWNPIPLQQNPKKPTEWHANGSFNWSGAPITLAWVDQATTSDGKTIDCEPVSDAPFNLADGTEFPRYVAGDPLPLLAMQQVQPALFTREVWPEYPLGKNGVYEAGFAVVQIVVDETGTIREAFLTQSSGVRSLDSAALYAATSSDYRPAASGGVALYEAVYQFVP
jgi:TonB family protein